MIHSTRPFWTVRFIPLDAIKDEKTVFLGPAPSSGKPWYVDSVEDACQYADFKDLIDRIHFFVLEEKELVFYRIEPVMVVPTISKANLQTPIGDVWWTFGGLRELKDDLGYPLISRSCNTYSEDAVPVTVTLRVCPIQDLTWNFPIRAL